MLMLAVAAVLCLLNNQAWGKYSIGLENTTVMSVHTWLRAAAVMWFLIAASLCIFTQQNV